MGMKFTSLLVTGGCGFIGNAFIRYLLNRDDFSGRIVNLDALTYAGNLLNLEDVERDFPERYSFIHGDIRDRESVRAVFEEHNIDAVVHFAAESHVDRSIEGPDDFITTNILGTFVLLEAARASWKNMSPVRFHHVSTDEVFGSLGADDYFSETTAYNPRSPYSASKASSDHLVRSYCHTYQLPVTLSNCSNNYGPRQSPEKLIPLMIENALEGKPLPVYGDGLNVRDWLHVDDHIAAICMILNAGRSGETYAVGGHNESTNIDLVRLICRILAEETGVSEKSYLDLISYVKDRPGHDHRYAIDASKIESELKWKPYQTLVSGMRQTIRWYLENRQWLENVKNDEYRSWLQRNYSQR